MHASTKELHDEYLGILLERLCPNDVASNLDKCIFLSNNFTSIHDHGIFPDPTRL